MKNKLLKGYIISGMGYSKDYNYKALKFASENKIIDTKIADFMQRRENIILPGLKFALVIEIYDLTFKYYAIDKLEIKRYREDKGYFHYHYQNSTGKLLVLMNQGNIREQ